MKKRISKGFSFLIALALVLTLIPLSSFADDGNDGNDGGIADPGIETYGTGEGDDGGDNADGPTGDTADGGGDTDGPTGDTTDAGDGGDGDGTITGEGDGDTDGTTGDTTDGEDGGDGDGPTGDTTDGEGEPPPAGDPLPPDIEAFGNSITLNSLFYDDEIVDSGQEAVLSLSWYATTTAEATNVTPEMVKFRVSCDSPYISNIKISSNSFYNSSGLQTEGETKYLELSFSGDFLEDFFDKNEGSWANCGGVEIPVYLDTVNGITPDDTQIPFKVEMYVNDTLLEEKTKTPELTVKTPNFGWTGFSESVYTTSHNAGTVAGDVIEPVVISPDNRIQFKYTGLTNNHYTSTGRADTGSVTITDTIELSEYILLAVADVEAGKVLWSGGNGTGTVAVGERDSTGIYVKTLKVTYTVENNGNDDLQNIGSTPTLTINGAKVDVEALRDRETNKLENGKTVSIADAFRSTDPKAVIEPRVETSSGNVEDGVQTLSVAGKTIAVTIAQLAPVVPVPTDPETSKNITKSAGTTTYVFAHDKVVYTLSNFGSKMKLETEILEDFTVTDTPDKNLILSEINTGVYQNPPAGETTYKVVIHYGNNDTETVEVLYATSKKIELAGYEDITKIEFQFGDVPPGFKPMTNNNPTVTGYVRDADADDPIPANVVNTATVTYTYKDATYSSEDSEVTLPYYSGQIETVTQRNKTLKVLRPSGETATIPAKGDYVEYTIQVVNSSGKDLQHPYIVDTFENLTLVDTLLPEAIAYHADAYKNSNGREAPYICIVPAKDSELTYDGNYGPDNGVLKVGAKGKIKAGESFEIKVIMQVSDDYDDANNKISNEFEAFAYPIPTGGSGPVNPDDPGWLFPWEKPGGGGGTGEDPGIKITTGYNNANYVHNEIPTLTFTQKIYKTDTYADEYKGTQMQLDEKLYVELTFQNTGPSKAGPVNLLGMLSQFSFANVGGEALYAHDLNEGQSVSYTYSGGGGGTAIFNNGYFAFDSALKVEKNETVTLRFPIKVIGTEEAPITQAAKQIPLNAYAQLEEKTSDYKVTGTVAGTDNSYLKPPAESYLRTTSYLYVGKTSGTLYVGISHKMKETPSNPLLINKGGIAYSGQAETDLTRTYYVYLYNRSNGANDQVTVDSVRIRLPEYETFDSVVTTGYTVTPYGDRYLEITKEDWELDPKKDGVAATIEIKTTVSEENWGALMAAITPNTSNPLYRDFAAAVITPLAENTDASKKGDVAAFGITGLDSNEKQLSTPITQLTPGYKKLYAKPGITIKATGVKASDNTTPETLPNVVIPGNMIGWEVFAATARSNDLLLKLENPVIVVELPVGMKYTKIVDNNGTEQNYNVSVSMQNNQEYVVIPVSAIQAGPGESFVVLTNTSGMSYGSKTAKAYLVPREEFIDAAPTLGTKDSIDMRDTTGSNYDFPNRGEDGKSPLVWAEATLNMTGAFQFSAHIEITAGGQSKKGPGSITAERQDAENITYTLTLKNGGNKTYEGVTLVNRLPMVGDLLNVDQSSRGSNFNVVLADDPGFVVSIGSRTLDASDYTIEYATVAANTVFGTGDYNLDGSPAAGWDGASSGATAFRITLGDGGKLEGGETLTVKYKAKAQNLPAEGAQAYNSFGFGFAMTQGGGKAQIRSEPDPVGISFPDINTASITGTVFFDEDDDGILDPGSEETYTREGDDVITAVLHDGEDDTELARMALDGNGSYKFDKLVPGTYYVALEGKPAKYGLTEHFFDDNETDPAALANGNRFEYKNTALRTRDIAVALNDVQNRNAGLVEVLLGTVTGEIFYDVNRNGLYEDAEQQNSAANGMTVYLMNAADGEVLATQTVAANGFRFTDVSIRGEYYLQMSGSLAANYYFTTLPDGAHNPERDHQFDRSDSLKTGTFTLPKDKEYTANRNAGVYYIAPDPLPPVVVTPGGGSESNRTTPFGENFRTYSIPDSYTPASTTTIADQSVPLDNLDTPYTVIDENAIPLAELPRTGGCLPTGSGCAVAPVSGPAEPAPWKRRGE